VPLTGEVLLRLQLAHQGGEGHGVRESQKAPIFATGTKMVLVAANFCFDFTVCPRPTACSTPRGCPQPCQIT
jgi:hypothetical protein